MILLALNGYYLLEESDTTQTLHFSSQFDHAFIVYVLDFVV